MESQFGGISGMRNLLVTGLEKTDSVLNKNAEAGRK
jgi:hypothetical protein